LSVLDWLIDDDDDYKVALMAIVFSL
jgi:hypothetical protein